MQCYIKSNEIALLKHKSIIKHAECIVDRAESAGDIQIFNPEHELLFLIERKTGMDLIASFKSRMHQKAQMAATPTKLSRGYIIEIDQAWKTEGTRRQIDGFVQNRMIQDQQFVLYSDGPKHSMQLIDDLCRKSTKYCDSKDPTNSTIVGAAIRKKDIMEPLVFAHWLEHLRGISKDTAAKIAAHCESPHQLVMQYSHCATAEEGKTLLQHVLIGKDKKGKDKKVGKSISETIYNAFHNPYKL